jgi:alpha-L-rhamnosidase
MEKHIIMKKISSLFLSCCILLLYNYTTVIAQKIEILEYAPFGLLCDLLSNPELTFISNNKPKFGWIVPIETQYSYQILVASTSALLDENKGDFWDSEKNNTKQSINIAYDGKTLLSNSSYWWKVKIWDSTDTPTQWSASQKFSTSNLETDTTKNWPGERKIFEQFDSEGEPYWTYEDRHPIRFHGNAPKRKVAGDKMIFYDFGKSAFAYLNLNITWDNKRIDSTKIDINLGEKADGDSIDKQPGGGIISEQYSLTLKSGTHNYILKIPRYSSGMPHSQKLPLNITEVIPFRYCEIVIGSEIFSINKIEQKALMYDHNMEASFFSSSNEKLNAVYNLCKYSTIANTFNGDYANSHRERMMYEADCYIQQMSHYALDREYKIQRYSTENLFYHATWPTEWIMHSVLMAYADYLHTGNTDLIENNYSVLKAKTLTALTTENGLISTQTGLQTKEFLDSIYFYTGSWIKSIYDIVDWPHGKLQFLPQGFGDGGETDNFEFENFNSVVNAFHYRCLILMTEMAKAIGNGNDAGLFEARAKKFKNIFNNYFINNDGLYIDGIGSVHSSIHANLFPLAFGLVPEKNIPTVVEYIKSKGMATGVYGANYLMEALYIAGEGDYALELLTAETDRSWMHMIEVGSTMTTEAWDVKYMPDYYGWSHAWSASPAHIIPRKLMGIEPLEAGFGKISIKPQPGNLAFAKVKLPTIRGDVLVDFETQEGKHFYLNIMIPGNTTGKVFLPVISEKYDVIMDGEIINAECLGNYCMVDNVSSGKHSFSIINTQ